MNAALIHCKYQRSGTAGQAGGQYADKLINPGDESFIYSFQYIPSYKSFLFTYFSLTSSQTEMVQALKTNSLMSRQTGNPAISTGVCRL